MSDDLKNANSGAAGGEYSASFGSAQMTGTMTGSVENNSNPGGGAGGSGQSLPVKDVTTKSFTEDVIEASKNQAVLVDFWAPWCGPCKQLGPVLEKVVTASAGKAVLAKMDIDKNPEIPGQMGIKSIPAVVAFVDGKPVDAFMGAVPESQILAFLDKLPSPENPALADDNGIETAMAQAAEMLEAGESAPAAEVYASVLAQEPGNLDAIAGLGECYLAVDEVEHARNIIANLPQDQLAVPVIAGLVAKIELAEQTASLGSHNELEQKIEANPKDYQARFDLALLLNSKNQREEAAQQLLEIVRSDRKWNDDGARQQLVQFFDIWGATDPATLSGRRGLSSLLFS